MPDSDDIFDVELNLNSLTIDEIEVIEDITGTSIDSILAPGAKRGKTLKALAYVARRRDDPSFTLEQAGALRFKLEADPPDPTSAAAS